MVSPLLEQAKGIGKKSFYLRLRNTQVTKCSAIEMTVISAREELIKWYQKHGYYKTGEVRLSFRRKIRDTEAAT